MLTCRERDIGGEARASIWIAVGGSCPLQCGGQRVAIWQRGGEADAVGAGIKTGELIPARAIGRGGADGCAAAVVKGDDHTFDAGFIQILLAIAVEVEPDEVADAGFVADEAKVDGGVVFTRHECDQRTAPGADVAIAVGCIRADLIGGTEDETIGQGCWDAHKIGAWVEVPEVVEADGVGGRGADRGATAVVESDDDVLDAGFADLLDAITIQILPDEVAE
jgi:hypothetical protein